MLINLFISFFKIGIFSFGGGYAALAIIQNEVVDVNHWLNLSEFNDLITISQMTPGPIAINSATFVGTKVAGFVGAIVATLAFVTPSLIIVTTLSYFYMKYRKLSLIDNILRFLRPAVVGLIFIASISVLKTAFFGESTVSFGNINILIVFLSVLAFYFLEKKKRDPILVMSISGVIYMAINLIFLK